MAQALNNLHMVMDIDIILGGHLSPYLEDEDLRVLFDRVNALTAFPEKETFIFQGSREKHAIAIGAGLPYIREYLQNL